MSRKERRILGLAFALAVAVVIFAAMGFADPRGHLSQFLLALLDAAGVQIGTRLFDVPAATLAHVHISSRDIVPAFVDSSSTDARRHLRLLLRRFAGEAAE